MTIGKVQEAKLELATLQKLCGGAGCEQYDDLAKVLEPELFDSKNGRGDPAQLVQVALRRLATMQIYSGGFSLWAGGQELHPWASVYAAHFLVEARRAHGQLRTSTRSRVRRLHEMRQAPSSST